ncbi:MAG: hypothetical protein IPK71_35340 [Myxococcales bacterium]|nr:hypothetical protein [Myxococcales bacterium]
MAKKSSRKSSTKRQRSERRFLPQSASNPWLVRVPGALGGMGIGAGVWGYLYGHFTPVEGAAAQGTTYNIPLFVLAGGAVLTAAAIWFGTSSEAAIRVGDPGISYEKGDIRRMPWWKVKAITFEGGSESLVVTGKDEADADFSFRIPARAHPAAVAWIVKEAKDRVPKKLDVDETTLGRIGEPSDEGTKILLEPLTVVGRRCAVSKKLIAYEPDAVVCPACERVYHKEKVPRKCACGNEFSGVKVTASEDEGDSDEGEAEAS